MFKIPSYKTFLHFLIYSKLSIVLTAIFAFIVSFSVWSYSKSYYEKKAEQEFDSIVSVNIEKIETRMHSYENLLKSGIGFFHGSNLVTREDWHNFVSALEVSKRYPGIQGFGFAKLFKPEDFTKMQQQMSKNGFSLKPRGKRAVYSAILYLEPLDKRNIEAIGYDMCSEPIRREAMQIACDSGRASISAKVRLVQEIDTKVQPGMLMYQPLYKKGYKTETVAQRREALKGFVYSPFRMNDLIDTIVQKKEYLNFKIYDGNIISPEHLLYSSSQNNQYNPKYFTEKILQVNNRQWQIFFSSKAHFDEEVNSHTPLLVTIIGLVIYSVLFIIILSLLKSRYLLLLQSRKNKEQTSYMLHQSRMAQMGEMISMIAHQWRQPLASISAISGTLLVDIAVDEYDSKFFEERLESISDLSDHLSSTIDDFRHFFTKNKKSEKATLKEIIDGTLQIIRIAVESNNIELIIKYNKDKRIETYVNEVKQVLLNILKNAEDALLEQEVQDAKIYINSYVEDDNAYICVEDNAGGIPEKFLVKIFDPYFSTKHSHDGTGLGLYMSKTIIEEHCKGKLDVQNSTKGAKFIITLPVDC